MQVSPAASSDDVLISCQSVWKLYGANADKVAAKYGADITDDIIAAEGLIPAGSRPCTL